MELNDKLRLNKTKIEMELWSAVYVGVILEEDTTNALFHANKAVMHFNSRYDKHEYKE